MEEVIHLAKAASLCTQLEDRLEESCYVPDGVLGGEMVLVYKDVREKQYQYLKKVRQQLLLCSLQI